jgi:hypothetical protein
MSNQIRRGLRGAVRGVKQRMNSGSDISTSIAHARTQSVDHSPVLPWGSIPSPGFGRMRKETGLSPKQMDTLVREHLPEENVDVCRQRNRVNKQIHRLMKQKKSKELELELEKLRSGIIPLDEVTYITLIFGSLLLPKQALPVAEAAFSNMQRVEYMHPALLELVGGFLTSLSVLEKFEAFPNRTAILKAMIPMQEIATDIRRLRMLGFRVAMSERIRTGQIPCPKILEPEIIS